MLGTRQTMRLVVAAFVTVVLAASMMGPLARPSVSSRNMDSGSDVNNQDNRRDKDHRCIQRSATAKPPDRLSPRFRARGRYQIEVKPLGLSPLCPQGQVAVPTSTRHFKPESLKGNPLLGYLRDRRAFERAPGDVIRKSLRPFDQVYWKGRGQNIRHHALTLLPDPACDGVSHFGSCYYYANAAFRRPADGGGMTLSIERPNYVSGESGGHTLAEIAIQGGKGDGNIVELGWNVSSDQYGNSNPHLFVFHWINWTPTCYDGCGWQQYSGTYFPGMDLSAVVGRQVYVGYVFFEGNWWAWFDNQWLGYFPGSEWSGDYTRSELIQWFGEVASSNGVPPRTDMGNGLFPTNKAAATMFTLCDVDAPAWVCWYRDMQVLGSTVPAYYDIARTGFGATRYGGPGE